MKNYYDILGISSNSTKQEIQKSFRNLAKKYHPDVNKDNLEIEKKFKEIKEAYEVLKDEKKESNMMNQLKLIKIMKHVKRAI